MNSGTDANGQVFAPEKGESYEIGSKYQFNDTSLLSLALFHMKTKCAHHQSKRCKLSVCRR
jgi:iron complex outermembrane receptor protein